MVVLDEKFVNRQSYCNSSADEHECLHHIQLKSIS